jgi:hypothetical protein
LEAFKMLALAIETEGKPGLWDAGGVTLKEAISFTTLSRGTLLQRIYAGEIPVSRQGRRLVLPRQFLVDMLATSTTGGK